MSKNLQTSVLKNLSGFYGIYLKILLRALKEQGVKLTFFPGSYLAPNYFKVVANSKKLVVIMIDCEQSLFFFFSSVVATGVCFLARYVRRTKKKRETARSLSL